MWFENGIYANKPETEPALHSKVSKAKTFNTIVSALVSTNISRLTSLKNINNSNKVKIVATSLDLLHKEQVNLISVQFYLYDFYREAIKNGCGCLDFLCHKVVLEESNDQSLLLHFRCTIQDLLLHINSTLVHHQPLNDLLEQLQEGHEQFTRSAYKLNALSLCPRSESAFHVFDVIGCIDEFFLFSIKDFSTLAEIFSINETLFLKYSSLNSYQKIPRH